MSQSRTYLELCRAVVSELGIAGGTGPSSVEGQVRELGNIVAWVADADIYVQNLWTDWTFLHASASGTVMEGESAITPPTDFENADFDGLAIGDVGARIQIPTFLDYREFRDRYLRRGRQTRANVDNWTITPAKDAIELSSIAPADIAWSLDYQRAPTRLAGNTARSPIPERFDRIIIVRAKLIYAEREDAPEITAGSSAEYADLLEKMESFYLPGQKPSRTAANRGSPQPEW